MNKTTSEAIIKEKTISQQGYNLTIGLVFCWTILVNWLIIVFTPVEFLSYIDKTPDSSFFYLFCAIAAIMLAPLKGSAHRFLSHSLMIIPFAFAFAFVKEEYGAVLLLDALVTSGVTIFLILLMTTLYQKLFFSLKYTLLFALITSLVLQITEQLVFHIKHQNLISVSIFILTAFAVLEFGKINKKEKTVMNAFSGAANLYFFTLLVFLVYILCFPVMVL